MEVRKAPAHMPVQSKYATDILGVLNNLDGVITATTNKRFFVFVQVNLQNKILKTW